MDESSLQKREQQAAPATPPAARPFADADIRASDADRDRVADILREALAEGRLTPEEHAERLDLLYAAKTMGELVPLTRDLPVPGQERPPAVEPEPVDVGLPARTESPNVVAIFGGASRKGRWRVGRRTSALAVFGGVEIDLTEAVFEQREVVIQATAVFGGVEITVPENVTLRASGGLGIFGGFDVKSHESADSNAPVVTVKGSAVFGGVEAKRKKGKLLKELGIPRWVRKQIDG